VTPVSLLDVNVLVALFDPDHVHHDPAHDWFADSRVEGWATCPLTENGLVRILSNPAYGSTSERPSAIVNRLRTFCDSGGHVFWPDQLSLRDSSVFPAALPVTSRQLTDICLLALARHRGGRLVTFDHAIPVKAVRGATSADLLVIAP